MVWSSMELGSGMEWSGLMALSGIGWSGGMTWYVVSGGVVLVLSIANH